MLLSYKQCRCAGWSVSVLLACSRQSIQGCPGWALSSLQAICWRCGAMARLDCLICPLLGVMAFRFYRQLSLFIDVFISLHCKRLSIKFIFETRTYVKLMDFDAVLINLSKYLSNKIKITSCGHSFISRYIQFFNIEKLILQTTHQLIQDPVN